jgi:hypothetical protein
VTVSAYPATVDTLLAIFHTAFDANTGDDTVRIVEGPDVSDARNKRLIWVGVEGVDEFSSGGAGVTGGALWATMGSGHSRDERFGVNCIADSWAGNQDPSSRRNEAFALFGAAVNALKADPSIGRPGGVLYLENYTYRYSVVPRPKGASGLISFTLNFRARI